MTEQRHFEDHQSLDRLLPWFVNATLDPVEHERVRRHLEVCEECRQSVALLSAVQSTVRHDTAIPMVPPPRTERLLEAIDGFDSGRKQTPRTATNKVIMASLAVALLTVALLIADRNTGIAPPALYETATSTQRPATMDYVLVVQFESGTPLVEQQRVLLDLAARDINRGESDGTYRVTVSLTAASLAELEQFTSDVEALPGIQSARVTALQFPVQRQP